MYIVQWCGHDGSLQERRFTSAEDAAIEADCLSEEFAFVQVIEEK